MRSSRPQYRYRKARGFSIIELVTVVAIVALMLAFAVPSFQEFVVNYRASVQTNDLLADIAVARGEAVKFARRTVVQAEPGGWSIGWIVGTDLDASGTVDANEIIKRHGPAEDGFTIAGGTTAGAAVTAIGFGPTGVLVLPLGIDAEFSICRPDNDPAKSKGVHVAQSGRASSRKAVDNDSFEC